MRTCYTPTVEDRNVPQIDQFALQHSLVLRAKGAGHSGSNHRKYDAATKKYTKKLSTLGCMSSFLALEFALAATPGHAAVVSACSGVSLPRSVVTDIVGQALNPSFGPASDLQSFLTTATLGTVNLGLTGGLAAATSGNPIALSAVDINGNSVDVATVSNCTSQADGYTLADQAGLAFGGNVISGLGTDGHQASAVEGTAIAIGDDARTGVGATGAVALGRGASVTATGTRGSVALGEGSSATGLGLATPAYAVGGTATSEVNVGTRRITGVAAGAADSDAANVAQLRSVAGAALNYDSAVTGYNATRGGLAQRVTGVAPGTLAVGSTDAVNGAQLNTTNGRVTANTNAITNVGNNLSALDAVALRYDNAGHGTVTLDGVTGTRLRNVAAGVTASDAVNVGQLNGVSADVTALADDALLYDGLTGTYRATRAGVSQKITGVANGTVAAGSTDAVNGGQLAATNANVTTNTTAITNLGGDVTALADDALLFDAGTGTYSATRAGVAQRITGVANGTVAAGSTDAVNGGQLATTNANVTTNTTAITNLGDNFNALDAVALRYDDSTHTTATLSGAGGTRIGNVAAGVVASDAVNVGQLDAVVANVSGLADDALLYNGTVYSATRGGVSQRISGVANGVIAAGSTDAVNGGQLLATNNAVAVNAGNIATVDGRVTAVIGDVNAGRIGPVRYSTSLAPTTPTNAGPTQDLTLVGLAAGPVSLHNVAAGIIGSGSSDAVNGGQLFSFGSSVATALGGGSNFNTSTGAITANLTFRGDSYGNVQGVVDAIDTAIGTGGGTGGTGTSERYFHANSTMADSQATGSDSTAIGPNAQAMANGAIAAGRNTMAASEGSVAIGDGAQAMAGKSVSIGAANIASGDGAVSIGDPNVATGNGAVALGRDNQATGTGTVALGDTNIIAGDSSVGIGGNNQVTGTASVTLGYANVVNGDTSLALGSNNQLTGSRSIALGQDNVITGNDALAVGSNVTAGATDTLAIGNDSSATQASSIALGNRAAASGTQSTAVGVDSVANNASTLAVGQAARATGLRSAALGPNSIAGASYTTAVGESSAATGYASTAVGTGATASNLGSTAIGAGASATVNDSVALGGASSATRGAQTGYTAFGLAAAQSTIGEVAIARTIIFPDPVTGDPQPAGTRQITGVGAGNEDTDAVNVAQLRGVSNTLGTAVASGFGGGSTYNATDGTISAPLYTVNGATYSNVGDAIGAITGVVNTVANTSVVYDSGAKDRVTLGGANGTTLANVAPGTLSATSTEAVNGAQLFATNQQVTANTTAITNINNNLTGSTVVPVQYSNPDTPTASNGGTRTNDVTLVGANAAAPVALHNVAAGQIAIGSTDAVNGGQVAGIASAASNSLQYDATATGGRADTVTLAGGTVGAPVTLRNVGPGTSATDAVNLGQLGSGLNQAVTASNSYTDVRVSELRTGLKKLRSDASGGTAAALALTSIPQAYGPGKGMIGFGMGTWGGERAIAIGASKATADGGFMIKAGASYNTRGDGGASVGAGFAF